MVHRLPPAQIELLARNWQNVFEQSELGILLVDPATDVIQAVNPAFARHRGYEAQEIVGRAVLDLFPPRLREEMRARFDKVGKSGHASFEAIHLRKDGSELSVLVDATLIRDARGKPISRVSCVLDIGDRKRMEGALRDSEQRFVRFMHHLPGLAWIKDLDGRYVYANAAAEKAFGVSLAELYGRTDDQIFPPETAAAFRANDSRALALPTGIQTAETLVHKSDGQMHHSIVSKFPILDAYGRAVMIGGTAIDITDRLQAERAVSDSEARFRLLAETMPSIMWTTTPDGTVNYANKRWLEFSGQPRPDDSSRWPPLEPHPDDRARSLARWADALRQGTPYENEVRLRRHDGAYRWYLTRALPQRNAEGRIVRWVGVSTDIHEQKELHERLREADRRKDEFIATLAHELRSPLAAVVNTADWLPMGGRSAEEVRTGLEIIRRQAGILSRLVEDLLDLSRISRGQLRLRKERVELSAVISGAVEALRPLFDASRHLLFVSLPQEPVWFEADPVRLSQVVTNLLNNAATYTPDRGRIELRAAVEGEEAVIEVLDTGIGIHADMLGRIFEPFAQAHEAGGRVSSVPGHPGLGIGLAISKQLVELHGGRIGVASDGAGTGSRFRVRLPMNASRASEAPTGETPRRAGPASARRRVLVVDDNRDAARILTLVLESMGHEAATARDGEDALAVAGTFRPHAVLLDIGLPKLDGYEVARQLRQRPQNKDALLVAVTGWGQEEDRARSSEAGFDHHLVKPVDPAHLRRILEEAPADANAPAAQPAHP